MKTWMFIYFNAVRTFYEINQSNHVTWMSYSDYCTPLDMDQSSLYRLQLVQNAAAEVADWY